MKELTRLIEAVFAAVGKHLDHGKEPNPDLAAMFRAAVDELGDVPGLTVCRFEPCQPVDECRYTGPMPPEQAEVLAKAVVSAVAPHIEEDPVGAALDSVETDPPFNRTQGKPEAAPKKPEPAPQAVGVKVQGIRIHAGQLAEMDWKHGWANGVLTLEQFALGANPRPISVTLDRPPATSSRSAESLPTSSAHFESCKGSSATRRSKQCATCGGRHERTN